MNESYGPSRARILYEIKLYMFRPLQAIIGSIFCKSVTAQSVSYKKPKQEVTWDA
jgi:hypothetical protein